MISLQKRELIDRKKRSLTLPITKTEDNLNKKIIHNKKKAKCFSVQSHSAQKNIQLLQHEQQLKKAKWKHKNIKAFMKKANINKILDRRKKDVIIKSLLTEVQNKPYKKMSWEETTINNDQQKERFKKCKNLLQIVRHYMSIGKFKPTEVEMIMINHLIELRSNFDNNRQFDFELVMSSNTPIIQKYIDQ